MVYVHAADCIGRFIVPCTKISEWTAQSKTRVFISAADALPKTLGKSPQMAAESTNSAKFKFPANVRALASKYTTTLKTVRDKRRAHEDELWEESRLVRVTGTSAKFVMSTKPASPRQVAQVLGLCHFNPTTQMQIGSILENKILTAYCKHEQLQLHK
jgi:hypothetical protein